MNKRAVVFIDGSNIYFAQKKIGKWFDWVKIREYLEKNYQVAEFRYYMGIRKNNHQANKFISKLKRVGFKVFTKPVKILINEKGEKAEKANFDVEITGDSLLYPKNFDYLVLFSGDSDFAYLTKLLEKQNKKIVVYSTRRTLAWELKLVTKYFFLEEIGGLTKEKDFVKLQKVFRTAPQGAGF